MPVNGHPHCVTLIGKPAAGKSTKAREYEAQGYTLISSDRFLHEIMQEHGLATMSDAYENHYPEMVERHNKLVADCLAEGRDIVFDSFNHTAEKRRYHMDKVKACGQGYFCEAVLLHAPEREEYERRLLARKREMEATGTSHIFGIRPSEQILMGLEFEMPCAEEGYDRVTEIGTKPKEGPAIPCR